MQNTNTDPATLKRAVAGAVESRVREIINSPEQSLDDIRLIIARFFVDQDLIDDYLNIITEAERHDIDLWADTDFRLALKNDIIKQFNRGIWQLNDSFILLAVMYGGYRASERGELSDSPSLNDIFGIKGEQTRI